MHFCPFFFTYFYFCSFSFSILGFGPKFIMLCVARVRRRGKNIHPHNFLII
jgi:hypothetical protein